MSFPIYVALVSQSKKVAHSQLDRVAAALQKQATRDFGPIWDVNAMVSSFSSLEDVPVGYWPIIIEDNINMPGAAGVHEDKDGQPFALVQYSSSWSLTASHECLEMLGDPFGNRLIAGQSPKKGQGRVEFLVEVCDPSEDAAFSYTSNGIMVSDFYTPHYFDPVKSAGTRYSFTGHITSPRQVLKGGYLSWHEPVSNHWWQAIFFGTKIQYRDLGVLGKLTGSLRSTIDSMTTVPELLEGVSSGSASLVAAASAQKTSDESTNSKAESWREQIKALKAGK
ncbi:MAG: hypothetical protein GC179_12695 [Anaerolineaceae bacterium]|nr:hypothetical protein [Anaerolineaceae bacterium]